MGHNFFIPPQAFPPTSTVSIYLAGLLGGSSSWEFCPWFLQQAEPGTQWVPKKEQVRPVFPPFPVLRPHMLTRAVLRGVSSDRR